MKKLTLFFDRNPATDEYVGDAVGVFLGNYCVIGLFKARHAAQFGIVLLNHAFGIWLEDE